MHCRIDVLHPFAFGVYSSPDNLEIYSLDIVYLQEKYLKRGNNVKPNRRNNFQSNTMVSELVFLLIKMFVFVLIGPCVNVPCRCERINLWLD